MKKDRRYGKTQFIYSTLFFSRKFGLFCFMMKKTIALIVFVFAICSISFGQAPDSSAKKLVSVDSLLIKIKPDTSAFIPDSLRVDTIYVDNPMNVLKVGVDFASAYSFASITYERVIHFMGSAQLKIEFLGTYNPMNQFGFIHDAYNNTKKVSGLGIIPEVRYYGTDNFAPKGLFVGVYVPLRFANVEVPTSILNNGQVFSLSNTTKPTTNLRYNLIGIGFDAGYHYLYKKVFSIEGLFGFSIGKGIFSEEYYTWKHNVYDSNLSVVKGEDGNPIVLEDKLLLKDGSVGNAFYPRAEISLGWVF